MSFRILLVEDDPHAAGAIRAAIDHLGHEVQATTTGARSALAEASRLRPDLALMDIHLDGVEDGLVAACELRRLHGLPVIFVTGSSDSEVLGRAQACEPYGIVLKPFAVGQLASAIDIARRRIALEAALRRGERRFRDLVEQLPVAVFTADCNDPFRLDFASPRASEITGYPPGSMIGNPDALRAIIHPDDLPRVLTATALLARGAAVSGLEYRVLCRDGGEVWVRCDARPHAEPEEGRSSYTGVLTDITPQRRMEQALGAQSRDAAVGRMAGLVAHEVNNPLAAIKARLHLLMLDHPASTPVGRGLEQIGQQVDRIATTVRDLQHLRGRIAPSEGAAGSCRSEAVMGAVAQAFAARARSLSVVLDLAPGSDVPPARIASDRLHQVLLALVENALDAAQQHGGGGRVVLRSSAGAGRLCIEVVDDGQGPGPEPERLFQPFFSTKPGRSGLGLTLARGTCEAAGGGLHAHVAEGGGSRFVIDLPTVPGDAPC